MKLRVFLLKKTEDFELPTLSIAVCYINRMIVIDYDIQDVKEKYKDLDIEEIGVYTGKEKKPCVICKEIIRL